MSETLSSSPQPALSRIPEGIFCAQDYELAARRFIAAPSLAYIAGGSGQDVTVAANRSSFSDWSVIPRVLADVTGGHTRLSLSGHEWGHPLLLAPLAFQTLAHPLGELETARAAQATDTCMVASTLSSRTLEDIASHAGPRRWFQLYLQPSREATLALLRRAEAAGYGAIVLTLDAAIQVPSLSAMSAGFRMPSNCVAANVAGQSPVEPVSLQEGQSRIFQGVMRQAPIWQDLDWLLTQTALPIWVKGVLHAQDAIALKARGVSGQVVSNHGGRGLDGAPATLSALPAIRAAVGDAHPLLLDGGIRSGTDVFKALALGADAVLIGRLQVYALSVAGALGVAHLLKLLREELEICMALAGCATLADIGPQALMPASRPALASMPESTPERAAP